MSAIRAFGARLEAAPERRFGLALLTLALVLRLSFLAFFLWRDLARVYGQDLYYNLALAWLGWEPAWTLDVTHPPLYTAFIAAVLGLCGTRNPLPVLLLQAALSAASCLLVYRLGKRLATARAARLGALWAACDPGLVFFAPHLQTETLFVFMELVFFLWLSRCLEGPHAPGEPPGRTLLGFFGVGLWGGLCSLCRSVFAAYPVFLALALLRLLGARRILWPFALLALGWLGPVAGWSARNWLKYHQMIPISAQMGWTLYEGFTLDREEVRRRPVQMAEEARGLGISDPIEAGRYFGRKTLLLVRERPLEAAGIVVGKALLYWRPWPYDPHSPAQRVGLTLYFMILFALAGLGAWRSRAASWLPVYALFAYLTAMHAVFFTSLRYRMPLEPFLCLLAAVGMDSLMRGRESAENYSRT